MEERGLLNGLKQTHTYTDWWVPKVLVYLMFLLCVCLFVFMVSSEDWGQKVNCNIIMCSIHTVQLVWSHSICCLSVYYEVFFNTCDTLCISTQECGHLGIGHCSTCAVDFVNWYKVIVACTQRMISGLPNTHCTRCYHRLCARVFQCTFCFFRLGQSYKFACKSVMISLCTCTLWHRCGWMNKKSTFLF